MNLTVWDIASTEYLCLSKLLSGSHKQSWPHTYIGDLNLELSSHHWLLACFPHTPLGGHRRERLGTHQFIKFGSASLSSSFSPLAMFSEVLLYTGFLGTQKWVSHMWLRNNAVNSNHGEVSATMARASQMQSETSRLESQSKSSPWKGLTC